MGRSRAVSDPPRNVNTYELEPHEQRTGLQKWLPFGAAGAVLAVVVIAGLTGGGDDTTNAAPLPSAAAVPTIAPVPSSAPPAVAATTAPPGAGKTPLGRTLTKGVGGKDVVTVQRRLKDLGFDPGPADGAYGTQTIQSVWAFEKLVMDVPRADATGQVTPEVWDRMQDPVEIKPRRPQGSDNHVEIYLPEQVMVVFHADKPVLITHVSTGQLDENGNPHEYRQTVTYDTDANGVELEEPVTKAIVGWAKTPPGVFKAYRFVKGTRNGPLGAMWNPIYINYGIAIHGALTVPLEPASHGCIRVPMKISEYLQDLIAKGDRVLIWDGVKEPEQQTKIDMRPIWDQPDPLVTTTTTTSTTLVPSTTTTTTVPAATATTKPAATTTTKPAATTVAPTTVAPTTTRPPTTTTHPPTTTLPPTTTTLAPTTTLPAAPEPGAAAPAG